MNRIIRLKNEAIASATWRGHNMTHFAKHGESYTAYCIRCGRQVTVSPHLMPNDIEVGGEAVALECERREMK